ncbi:hypothetical protein TSMEX_002711 [Taenia solium]|eukprot:TsM_000637700 transcript=TsM_000637700 gene=TsM_000637700
MVTSTLTHTVHQVPKWTAIRVLMAEAHNPPMESHHPTTETHHHPMEDHRPITGGHHPNTEAHHHPIMENSHLTTEARSPHMTGSMTERRCATSLVPI